MMTSRERVLAAINHRQPDRVPIDFGGTGQTGMSVSAMYRLREYLGLPKKALDVYEVAQMLGVFDEDLRQEMGSDVIGLENPTNSLGVPKTKETKEFLMPDGTPTRMAIGNEFDYLEDGSRQMYPQGDRSAKPSLYMPEGGYFFDIIDRAPEYDEDNLTPREDFENYFSIITDDAARYYEKESIRLYTETDYAIIGNLGGASFGDPGALPAAFEKNPKGIRKFDQWCMAQLLYPEYIQEVFEMQTEYMLKNLEIYKQAVGDRIQMIWVTGTDFGTQTGAFMSQDTFRDLYKPYYKRVCDWIHQNTDWKTFMHSCGSVVDFLDDFVEMGIDILNPVQLSAKGMDAKMLKEKYGDKLVFWGGGVDTQATLPDGTPEEIEAEVMERLDILSKGGGYVFNTVHNIVGNTKPENIVATYKAVQKYNKINFNK